MYTSTHNSVIATLVLFQVRHNSFKEAGCNGTCHGCDIINFLKLDVQLHLVPDARSSEIKKNCLSVDNIISTKLMLIIIFYVEHSVCPK